MKAAALCAGYGGLELGLQQAGWDIELAWYSEIDRHASTVMAAHHPGVPNLGDLTQITDPPAVDVVAAGFPCQPVSHAGKRQGVNDERWLIDDVCRIASDAGARWLVLENVPGIFTANRGDAFYHVLRALAEIGFAAEWGCLPASDVGAPHGRLRWFCVGYSDSVAGQPPVAFGRGPRPLGESRKVTGTVGSDGSLADGPAAHPDNGRREQRDSTVGGLPVVGEDGTQSAADPDPDGDGHGPGQDARRVGRMDRQDAGGTRQRERARTQPGDRSDAATADADGQRTQVPPARRQSAVEMSGSNGEDRSVQWGPYTDAIRRWEPVIGRPAPDPTDSKRRLNPRFVEWMMGLPDGWVCDYVDGRSHQLRILGNGVVPQQAGWAIRQLAARTATVVTTVTPDLQSGIPSLDGPTTYGGNP